MKGFCTLLLFMAAAATTLAGENGFATLQQKQNSTAPPIVKERYEYYEVCGCCEKDLVGDLKQKCIRWNDGKKYDSVTNWKMKWDYRPTRTPEACIADAFTVTVDVTFHVPKWVRTGNAPQPLADKWDSYLANLMTHEKGHRDRVVEVATELTNSVAKLPPARTCDELERTVRSLGRAELGKLHEEQNIYDTTTDHGAAQGAVFP